MAKAFNMGLIERDPLAWLEDGKDEEVLVDGGEMTKSLMDTGIEQDESGADRNVAHLELAVSPDLAGVSQLHGQLKEVLDSHQAVEIDASNVESIDTSTLQLLLIFRREAVNLHKTVVFKAPSESFVRSAKLLALDGLMGLE